MFEDEEIMKRKRGKYGERGLGAKYAISGGQ